MSNKHTAGFVRATYRQGATGKSRPVALNPCGNATKRHDEKPEANVAIQLIGDDHVVNMVGRSGGFIATVTMTEVDAVEFANNILRAAGRAREGALRLDDKASDADADE